MTHNEQLMRQALDKEVKERLASIRSRIREERERKGLSQGDMARKLNLSRPYYCQLESGTKQISTRRLITIAMALNVKLEKLCKLIPKKVVVVQPEDAETVDALAEKILSAELQEALKKAKEERESVAKTGYSEAVPKKRPEKRVVNQSQWTYSPS